MPDNINTSGGWRYGWSKSESEIIATKLMVLLYIFFAIIVYWQGMMSFAIVPYLMGIFLLSIFIIALIGQKSFYLVHLIFGVLLLIFPQHLVLFVVIYLICVAILVFLVTFITSQVEPKMGWLSLFGIFFIVLAIAFYYTTETYQVILLSIGLVLEGIHKLLSMRKD